jgi:starch-binding outer membrane protein, SusD/RagB family
MTITRAALVAALSLALGGCNSILDLKDLEAIDERDVWNSAELAEAYVNRMYMDNLPGWSTGDAGNSDESPGGDAYMYGQLTENSVDYWPYGSIRRINILLTEIDKGTIDTLITKRLKGEAYFFRAWRYWEMVKRYGGVPLILRPQALTDSLRVPRDSTSTVVRQIVADLDSAIVLLPSIRATSADNDGRVHKGTALALKGRVLLYYASPQFTRTGDPGRWQTAYDANLAARDYLTSQGFGLYDDFAGLWFVDMNKEAIFVRRYSYPLSTHNWAAATRPLSESQNATGANRPTLEMVNAFPMRDGRSIAGHPAYDTLYYWKNRDPRFYATIAYNGCLWELSGKTGRRQWTYLGAESNVPTPSSFYTRKAVDPAATPFEALNGQTQWIEIRFAEVLMNLAEAANAIGNTQVAYDQIKALRARAGIDLGAGFLYGLDPGMSGAPLQAAIMHERRIEFAYEAKRSWDLRRNRLFESALNGTRRHGLKITFLLRPPADSVWLQVRDTVDLDATYQQYFAQTVNPLDAQVITWQPNYYFYGIPRTHLDLNPNLKQTLGWEGAGQAAFDPLR